MCERLLFTLYYFGVVPEIIVCVIVFLRFFKLYLPFIVCGVHQCVLYRKIHSIENRLFISKAYLGLCGVYVYIDSFGRKRYVQYAGREFSDHHTVTVCLLKRRHTGGAFYISCVHEKRLHTSAVTAEKRR